MGDRAESALAPVRCTNVLAAEFRALRPAVGWPGPGRRSLAPPHPDSAAAVARLPAATVRMIAAVIRPISRERCGRRRSQGLGTRRHRPRKRRCARRGWGQIVTGKRTRLHWPEMGQSQPGRLDALGLAA